MRLTLAVTRFGFLKRHAIFSWQALYYLFAGISLGGYLFICSRAGVAGFPLDDAWIHQTYARNLVQYGEWSFIPGEPSAGSTAPLWSAILAAGYLLRVQPLFWSFLLGGFLLGTLSLVGAAGFRYLAQVGLLWSYLAGMFFVFEWHLVWAAGSGMETLLFALLALIVLVLLVSPGFIDDQGSGHRGNLRVLQSLFRWAGIGILIALSAWVRPDGITLLGPVGFVLLAKNANRGDKLRKMVLCALGFLLLFIPYLFFNHLVAGSWWPNTFYAKQAEYAIYRQIPLWQRILAEGSLPLIGAGSILLPGFVIFLFQSVKFKNWPGAAVCLWVCGYLGLYALRLPVSYQHGRYVIPAMPAYFLAGLAGYANVLHASSGQFFPRFLGRVALVSAGLVLVVFWWLGGEAYARDVLVIESEMVATAHWVSANTPEDALIAAHDIGALGYFGNRRILDLAGLVSPEVIPIIRDENQLSGYIEANGARYLVTFPAWYPILSAHGQMIFQTQATASPSAGGENMAVYRWNDP